jgi:hypothetical protein
LFDWGIADRWRAGFDLTFEGGRVSLDGKGAGWNAVTLAPTVTHLFGPNRASLVVVGAGWTLADGLAAHGPVAVAILGWQAKIGPDSAVSAVGGGFRFNVSPLMFGVDETEIIHGDAFSRNGPGIRLGGGMILWMQL